MCCYSKCMTRFPVKLDKLCMSCTPHPDFYLFQHNYYYVKHRGVLLGGVQGHKLSSVAYWLASIILPQQCCICLCYEHANTTSYLCKPE